MSQEVTKPKKRWSRRSILPVSLLLVFVGLPLMYINLAEYGWGNLVPAMRSEISKKLPVGVDKASVISFLQKRHLEYGSDTEYKSENKIIAWGQPTDFNLMCGHHILLRFTFNEWDKLTSYTVEQQSSCL